MNTSLRRPGTMATALRGALRQARIELRIQLFSWNVLSWVMFPAIGLLVMYFLRDREVMGSEVSLAQLGVPGILAMSLISTGVLGVAGQLLTERDDGTLLRAKAVPTACPATHGQRDRLHWNLTGTGPRSAVAAGFHGSPTTATGGSPSPGWRLASPPRRWRGVRGVDAKPVILGWASGVIIYGGMAISGVFYPITALPGWLQVVGQVLPTYWLGLGLRSALLPTEAMALEVGGSWHTVETVAALGGWTAVGLVLAPIALRRMARHQSGSQVAAARERVMARGY